MGFKGDWNFTNIRNKIKNTFKNYLFIFKSIWEASPKYFIILIIITLVGSFLPLVSMFMLKNIINLLVYEEKNTQLFIKLILFLGISGISIITIELINK